MELDRPTDKLRSEKREKYRSEVEKFEIEDLDLYAAATPRERSLLKARAIRKIKQRARNFGLDPENFLELSPDQRRQTIEELAQDENESPEQEDDRDREPLRSEAPLVFTEGMNMPADDMRPDRRAGITVGNIVATEVPPDLVGDQPPRTFADLYARWPIGRPGGEDFYIHVERIMPKKFGEVHCAGTLGKISVPMSEEQFGKWFGGREYYLTVYGPTPTGRRDANGDLIIKDLTKPIHVTVPYMPPILHPVIPSSKRSREEDSMYPEYPYPHPATTAADASIHSSTLKHAMDMTRFQVEQLERAKREARGSQEQGQGDPTKLLSFVGDMSTANLNAIKEDAQRREDILRDQLRQEREDRKNSELELRQLKDRLDQAGLSRSGDSLEMLKFSDSSAQRQSEYYRQELDVLRRSNEEQLRHLKETHAEELRRERERYQEQEQHFKRQGDEDRRLHTEREKAFREEVDRVRREERDAADRRVADVEKVAEQRYRDQEKAHEREVRTTKESLETRFTSAKANLDFEITSLRNRLEEAKAEVIRIREESDPVQIITKRKEEAKLLGFVEKDADAPSGPWDRLLQAAGAGIGQMMSRIDGNAVMSAIGGAGRAAMAPNRSPNAQLPAAQRAAAAAQISQRQAATARRRGAVWASQGSPVTSAPPPAPVGSQPPAPNAPPPAPPNPDFADAPTAPPTAPPPAQQAPAAAAPPPAQQQIKMPPSKFHQFFTDEQILIFLQTIEGAINSSMDANFFAQQLVERYPEAAQVMVQQFRPDDAIEYVRSLPNAEASSILRRDGKNWLEKLWPILRKRAAVLPVADPGQQAEMS